MPPNLPVRPAASAPMITVMSESTAPEIERVTRHMLDTMLADGSTPGLQYVFASDEAVRFSHHGGAADLLTPRAVTERSTFNAYSVTKTFTAAAVLQLVERRLVDLDQPIARYLDRWPHSGDATVRQTLLHTAGFANPNPLRWVHLAEEHAAFDRDRFVEEVIRAHGRPVSQPGARYAYSNIGYLALGDLIEKVSRQPFVQYVQQYLLAPLRLRDGAVIAFDITRPDAHAHGMLHHFGWLNLVLGLVLDRGRLIEGSAGRWVQFRDHHVNGDAYGGLIGNALGFTRFLQALLTDELLTPMSRAALFKTESAPGPARSLGGFTGRLGQVDWLAHAGGGAGYYSEIRVYPQVRKVSVVMLNRAGMRDERLLDRLDSKLIGPGR